MGRKIEVDEDDLRILKEWRAAGGVPKWAEWNRPRGTAGAAVDRLVALLVSPEPKVGDSVTHDGSSSGRVLAVDGDFAWVYWARSGLRSTWLLAKLTVIS